MNLEQAKDLATLKYAIVFPMTMDDFLKVRASIIMKHHSDKNENADTETFNEVLDMFKVLKENFDIINCFTSTGDISGSKTRTGELLVDLGKGLGNLINGKECPECKHKGYTVQEVPIFGREDYTNCDCDQGYIHGAPCRSCNGTGIFHTKSGFDVKCKSCKGTKVHIYDPPIPCPKCSKRKVSRFFDFFFSFERVIGHRKEYHKCYKCEGTGEIEIHNPVFQKGAMNVGTVEKKNVPTDTAAQLKRFNKIMKGIDSIKNKEKAGNAAILESLERHRPHRPINPFGDRYRYPFSI